MICRCAESLFQQTVQYSCSTCFDSSAPMEGDRSLLRTPSSFMGETANPGSLDLFPLEKKEQEMPGLWPGLRE